MLVSVIGDAIDGFFEAIEQFLDGVLHLIPALLQAYTIWFVVQASLVAFFPIAALPINAGFFLITLWSLKTDAQDILGAQTIVAAALAFIVLAFNVWLLLVIH